MLQQRGCGESFCSPHPGKLLLVTPIRGFEGYPVGNTLFLSESGCVTPSKCLYAQDS